MDVLPKDYGRPALDKTRLGQVVDVVSNIELGGADARATDVLGNVYEYFLEQFALAEGRKGGEFYTPRSVVRLLVADAPAPTAAASTTPAAARQACSCSPWSSSAPTPAATATPAPDSDPGAVRPGATSPSTARSRTTPPGGWRR